MPEDAFTRRRPELVHRYLEARRRREPVEGVVREYLELLPRPAVARCPVTGEVVRHSLDTVGLDGPWWEHDALVRPVEERPATFVVLTGAVRVTGDPPEVPFPVVPGPGAPYVLPEVLRADGVVAVVSQLAVGPYDAWPITYFADPIPEGLRVPNTWGADMVWWETDSGEMAWHASAEESWEHDFDLAPWIRAGKLRWIAPGDKDLALRDDPEGCPFLAVDGPRAIQRLDHSGLRLSPPRPSGLGAPDEGEAPAG